MNQQQTPPTGNGEARGFDQAFRQLRSHDARYWLRRSLTEYFGSNGSYYRHRYGQRPMTAEQLSHVEQLFRQWGYTGPVADSQPP